MSKRTSAVVEGLRKQWAYPDAALLTEFRGGTGWSRDSRADALAMHLWPSKGLELIGFEIKTSRSDWLRELKDPGKAEPIKQFCDRWYLLIDDSRIAKLDEVPDDWGLLVFTDGMIQGAKWDTRKEAPKLNPKPVDRPFLASLMRVASRQFSEVIVDGRKFVAQ